MAATPRRCWPPRHRSRGARGWRCRSRRRIAFRARRRPARTTGRRTSSRHLGLAGLGAHHVPTNSTRSARSRSRSCAATACCGRSTRTFTPRCSSEPRAGRCSPGSAATSCSVPQRWCAAQSAPRRPSGAAATPSADGRPGARAGRVAAQGPGRPSSDPLAVAASARRRAHQPAASRLAGAHSAVLGRCARTLVAEPQPRRAVADVGVAWRRTPARRSVQPFLEPAVLRAAAARYGRRGPSWSQRGHARPVRRPRALSRVLARRSKAAFDEAFFSDHSRAFAVRWSGGGVERSLVSADAVAAVWNAVHPDPRSFSLMQAAWLATEGSIDNMEKPL